MKLNSHKFAYALTVNVMDGSLVEYHDCLCVYISVEIGDGLPCL